MISMNDRRKRKEELMLLLEERLGRRFDENCKDRYWRLNNLYYIKTDKGEKVLFKFNEAQENFYKDHHTLNIILKARQLGFTTLIQLMMLDACIFNDNISAGVVAQTSSAAEEFFDNKIKFAWDNINPRIKDKLAVDNNSAKTLKFGNGSKIIVATQLRSGTFQYLHVSEYGKICVTAPQKADEIRSGAFNTVATGQYIFIESTAEGQGGSFYDMVQASRKFKEEGKTLTEMDFKFFFYSWHLDESYTIEDGDGTAMSETLYKYFNELKIKGIHLTQGQKNWYVKKHQIQLEKMKREYPTTPEDAFENALNGSYFINQMTYIRQNKQLTNVQIDYNLPVNTFWDLGISDYTSIFFHQHYGSEHRFIKYYENNNEGILHYISVLNNFQQSHDFVWGTHYGPHDLAVRELISGKSRLESFKSLGIGFTLVPRTKNKSDSIHNARQVLKNCWFDQTNCSAAIAHLDNYTKEWDKTRGMWRDKPDHNLASNCADAFMCFADGYEKKEKAISTFTMKSPWA